MGGGAIFICLALSMHAASSISIINPSSSTINPSSSTYNPSNTTSSSSTNLSSQSSSFTVKPLSTSSSQFGLLSPKPSSSYQVTENVIDVPDDRTLPPIAPNFSLFKPLNVANTTITINKVSKNDTGDENNQVKKTSFTYIHYTKDSDEKKEKKEGGIKKLFKGIRDYVYNFKKGVVDGLHHYFHKDDEKNDKEEPLYTHKSNRDFNKDDDEVDFHHKFHRNFHSNENFDDFNYDNDEFSYEAKDLND